MRQDAKRNSSFKNFGLAVALAGVTLATACQSAKAESTAPATWLAFMEALNPMPEAVKEGLSPMLIIGYGDPEPPPPTGANKEWLTHVQPPCYGTPQWLSSSNAFRVGELADMAKRFYETFPEHKNANRAKALEYSLLTWSINPSLTNTLRRLQGMEARLLQDPTTPSNMKVAILLRYTLRPLALHTEHPPKAVLLDVQANAMKWIANLPPQNEFVWNWAKRILFYVAFLHAENGDFEEARGLLKTIVGFPYQREAKKDDPMVIRYGNQAPDPYEPPIKTGYTLFLNQRVFRTAAGKPGMSELFFRDQPYCSIKFLKRLETVGRPVHFEGVRASDGVEYDMDVLKGKVVILWIKPTDVGIQRQVFADTASRMRGFQAKYGSKGLDILNIGVSRDANWKEWKFPWPALILAGSSALATPWLIESDEENIVWVLDQNRRLRYISSVNLDQRVESLLAQ